MNLYTFRWLCYVLLICVPIKLNAQGRTNSTLDYYGVEQGLSNNDIHCIYQSKEGFVWIGTTDGLNRFDGTRNLIIRRQPEAEISLPSNRIKDIIQSANLQMIISTSAGVIRYDPLRKMYSHLYNRDSDPAIKSALNDEAILKKSGKDILIGTSHQGLLRYTDQSNKIDQIPLIQQGKISYQYPVADIFVSPNQQTWILISGLGIATYDNKTERLLLVNTAYPNAKSIALDSQDRLILGTDQEIITLSADYRTINRQKIGKEIIRIDRLNRHELWASSDGGGLWVRQGENLDFQNLETINPAVALQLSSNSFTQVYLDRNSNYWLGTVRGGINLLKGEKRLFQPIIVPRNKWAKINAPYLSSFCEISADELWFGTDGQGLFRFNRKTEEIGPLKIKGLRSNHLTSLLKDSKGRIWVAAWSGGVHRIDSQHSVAQPVRFENELPIAKPQNIWRLYMDRRKNIWASSYGEQGLFLWDESQQQFISYSKKLKNILCFAEDDKGNLWMGSDDYLIKLNLADRTFHQYQFAVRIRALHLEGKTLWVGTEGSGLLAFDTETARYKHYNARAGFSNENILNILADNEGNLWCSTFNGLHRFNKQTRLATAFFKKDGLQDNRFTYLSALKLADNRFVFGGSEGFNIFAPHAIKLPEIPFHVDISNIKINGEEISSKENWPFVQHMEQGQIQKIILPYHKRSIEIDYASFNFANVGDVTYEAKLFGLDSHWKALDNTQTLQFTNLPPGSYQLHIRGIGSKQSSPDLEVLQIEILQPWYFQPLSITIFLLVILMLAIVYRRINQQKKKLKEEASITKLQRQMEKEFGEKKLSFFAQILQDLRAPITLIINPINELMKDKELQQNSHLLLAQRNTNKLILLTEQFEYMQGRNKPVSMSKLQNIDLMGLLINEFETFKNLALLKNIDFSIHYQAKELMILANAQQVELILYNLMLNAIEHVANAGKVGILVNELSQSVQLSICDSGKPLFSDYSHEDLYSFYEHAKAADKPFRLELLMVLQMIQEHSGSVLLESYEDGNKITITFQKAEVNTDASSLSGNLQALSDEVKYHVQEEPLQSIVKPLQLGGKKKILILENDPEMRSFLVSIFNADYDVSSCKTIHEAWELVEMVQPHIIITELFVDKSGLTFCRQLKKDARFMHLPIIIISSSVAPKDQLESIALGAEEFISKPFDQAYLLLKVQSIFANRLNMEQHFLEDVSWGSLVIGGSETDRQFLETCIQCIERNFSNQGFNATKLAEDCHMSYSNLFKKIRGLTGLSISAFIRSVRLKRAAELMFSTDLTIHEIAYQVGILDIKYFREKFKDNYSMTPSQFIKKYRPVFNSMQIRS